MNAPAERKKTRLERAAEAWEAAERERHANPPDLARLQEGLGGEMGAKLHELASRPPRRSLQEELEYLRLWLVYLWEMQCDTVFPGHRHIGDRLHWVAGYRLDPSVMMYARGDWTQYALGELAEWLRLIERNLANEIAPERPG